MSNEIENIENFNLSEDDFNLPLEIFEGENEENLPLSSSCFNKNDIGEQTFLEINSNKPTGSNKNLIDNTNLTIMLSKNRFWCYVCESMLSTGGATKKMSNINNHVLTLKHQKNFQNFKSFQSTLKCENIKNFHYDLCKAFVIDNIPFEILNKNTEFSKFMIKYTSKTPYSPTHYRNEILPSVYNEQQVKNYKALKGRKFYLMIDGGNEKANGNIYNVIGGVLDEKEDHRPILLGSHYLEDSTTQSILYCVEFELKHIIDSPSEYANFRLFVTDGAANMKLLGKKLQLIYGNLKYITCSLHFIHNISLKLFDMVPYYKSFESIFSNFFKNSEKRKVSFKNITGIPLENFGVSTRWGTKLKFSSWVFDNLQLIRHFLIKNRLTENLKNLNILISEREFLNDLYFLNNFREVPIIIEKMEANNILVRDNISYLQKIYGLFNRNRILENYFMDWLDNNFDIDFFWNYSELICDIQDRCLSKAPMTTAEVERSFRALSIIVTDLRCNLSEKSVSRLLNIYYNNRKPINKKD